MKLNKDTMVTIYECLKNQEDEIVCLLADYYNDDVLNYGGDILHLGLKLKNIRNALDDLAKNIEPNTIDSYKREFIG